MSRCHGIFLFIAMALHNQSNENYLSRDKKRGPRWYQTGTYIKVKGNVALSQIDVTGEAIANAELRKTLQHHF